MGADPTSTDREGLYLPLGAVSWDELTVSHFTSTATVTAWLDVERALAACQAELGLIPVEAADAIQREVQIERVDLDALHDATRVVGYPILPLLRQLSESCSPIVGEYIHWGATTQDIMDTGRAIQIRGALERFERLLTDLGDALSLKCQEHRHTLIAGRTHAQTAVPTTLGAKFAVWLDEFCRHRDRVRVVRPRVSCVSLFGAAGTNAALGAEAGPRVRQGLASRLELTLTNVPWHVSRDNTAELAFVLSLVSATCVKIAREVVDLSRPEIDELREAQGYLKGASSTMPQKANPITSETIIGLGLSAQSVVPQLLRAMHGGHERSAGEWQSEWDAIPLGFAYSSGALARTLELVAGLQTLDASMSKNLRADGGLVMAEALMMRLARSVGRARAHEIVYRACQYVRDGSEDLARAAQAVLREDRLEVPELDAGLEPDEYLGEAELVVDDALGQWARLAKEE